MIPSRAHFIWIGAEFPWLNYAALASAARHAGLERVRLHHTHDLSGTRWWPALQALPGVETQRLAEDALIDAAAGPKLVDRYRSLRAPAARANVLRVALLKREGGVYLDLDTVTCQSLAPLLEQAGFFCGTERIAFPGRLRQSVNPLAWGAAYLRTTVRDLLRRSADGVRWFQRIEAQFPAAANNAVLGARAEHPVLAEMVERMLALSARAAGRRFALGTGLLQAALASTRDSDVLVHPPRVFYPLGPEISEHWFRRDTRARLDDVLSAETRVVHWYASVRTRRFVPEFEPSWVLRHRGEQLLSELLFRALGPEALGAPATAPQPPR